MRVHYAAPMTGCHEADEWNPVVCGIEDRCADPAVSQNWEDVDCRRCLARRGKP